MEIYFKILPGIARNYIEDGEYNIYSEFFKSFHGILDKNILQQCYKELTKLIKTYIGKPCEELYTENVLYEFNNIAEKHYQNKLYRQMLVDKKRQEIEDAAADNRRRKSKLPCKFTRRGKGCNRGKKSGKPCPYKHDVDNV